MTGFVAEPGFAREWRAYKAAQAASDAESLPAEFSWLHPWAGTVKTPRDQGPNYATWSREG